MLNWDRLYENNPRGGGIRSFAIPGLSRDRYRYRSRTR